jgi:hypothetical protein
MHVGCGDVADKVLPPPAQLANAIEIARRSMPGRKCAMLDIIADFAPKRYP